MFMSRKYYYMGINGTPFSLVLSLPHKYGFSRIQHPVENDIHRIRSNDRRSLREYFNGSWTIHPDWYVKNLFEIKHLYVFLSLNSGRTIHTLIISVTSNLSDFLHFINVLMLYSFSTLFIGPFLVFFWILYFLESFLMFHSPHIVDGGIV